MGPFLPGPGPLAQPAHHTDAATAAPPDAWASVVQSSRTGNYRGSYSAISSAADQIATSDGFAAMTQSRRTELYRSARSGFFAAWDDHACSTLFPDTILFPETTLFPDLCAPTDIGMMFQSRPSGAYSAPRSKTIQNFSQQLDAWAQTTFGRATPYYAGSRPVTIAVYDPATNTFADWTPAALLSRAVTAYSAPKAQPTRAYDQPAASGNDYASSALSRRVANYVGSYSAVWNAADAPAAADTWASIFASRAAQRYAAPRALVVPVYDPATNTFADWTPSALLSRRVAGYAAPLSRTAQSYDQPAVVSSTDWASVAQGYRAAFRYQGPQSRTIAVYDPATNSFRDWTPSALTSRSAPLFRSPAAFLACAYAQPVFGTDYAAPASQGRRSQNYRGSYSAVSNAVDDAIVVVFGTDWASVFQSRPVARYSAKSWMGNAWTLGSGVDPGPPPPQPDPYVQNLAGYGGGGFGAVMSDDFFKRYDARYKPRYVGRYKPTIRKQKP